MRYDLADLPPDRPSGRAPYVITSAYRTLEILRFFSTAPHRYSLAEVVAALTCDKGQAYRSLKTLEEAGFLRVNADGRFSLTLLLSTLGIASLGSENTSLSELAAPLLNRLAGETGETVHLFARVVDEAICIGIRESHHPIRLSAALGVSAPLHAGASPKAILAFLPNEEQKGILARLPDLPKYTSRTFTNTEALEAELQKTVARGYAISDEDVDIGARGVGAPIFDREACVIGAISVGGPAYRVDDTALKRFSTLIVQGTQAISRQLGYTG